MDSQYVSGRSFFSIIKQEATIVPTKTWGVNLAWQPGFVRMSAFKAGIGELVAILLADGTTHTYTFGDGTTAATLAKVKIDNGVTITEEGFSTGTNSFFQQADTNYAVRAWEYRPVFLLENLTDTSTTHYSPFTGGTFPILGQQGFYIVTS